MLSDVAIRKAKARVKAYRMADGRGLYLLVTPAGGKLWRFKYRFQKQEKLMALGKYPDVPLLDAREAHSAARRLLATGIDPMALRKQEKTALASAHGHSFRTVALEWWDHWRTGKSERHAVTTKTRLEDNVFPTLGARPIQAIEAPELVAMVKAIEKRGALDVARRAFQTTGQIFRYAIAHGLARRNPAADIRPTDLLKPSETVNFARIEANDLPKLLQDIREYRGEATTRLAMDLMALTFLRTSELILAPWNEIDFEAERWDIPAARMKMKTPHIVPLSRQAIEILKALKLLTGHTGKLFPGADPLKHMSNNTILFALYRMGYKGEMTGHGFRGLAATILNEHDFNSEHVDLQLAHMKRNTVSAAYNHAKYLKQRAHMMQWWADYLDEQRAKAVVRDGTSQLASAEV